MWKRIMINDTCAAINKKHLCSGGALNPSAIIDELHTFLQTFPSADLRLTVSDGLKYFQHIEQVAWYESRRHTIKPTEIQNVDIDLPNYVMDKFCDIVNQTVAANTLHMHSMCFLVEEDSKCKYTKRSDDIQIIQVRAGQYTFIHHSHDQLFVRIFHVSSQEHYSTSLKPILKNRYGTEVTMQYEELESGVDAQFTGVIMAAHCCNFVLNNQMPQKQTHNIDKLLKWFLNFFEANALSSPFTITEA